MLIVLISGACAIHLESIVRLDRMILEWFATCRSLACDQFFAYVSWAGSSLILLPVILAQAVILTIRTHIQNALFLVGSFVGASTLNNIFKLVIARPRPDLFPALSDLPAGFSFPSSHAVQITAFVLAELLLLNITTGARWFFLLNMVSGGLILLVCISRMYLQVHYPTDVVAGFLIALFWVFGLATLMLPDHNKRGFFGRLSL
ncbi:MAG: phosphatase PAP2 family protein [Deltaproteobacteria bacterium]